MFKKLYAVFIIVLVSFSFIMPISAQEGIDPLDSEVLTRPMNAEGITEIAVGIYVSQVTDFDEQSETFTVEAMLRFTWHDPRQAFDAAEFGTDSRHFVEIEVDRLLQLGDLWFPELYIPTEQGRPEIEQRFLEINADGTIMYQQRFQATIQDPIIDFHEFPFDEQLLQIPIESLIYPADEVVLTIDEDFTGLGSQLGIEDWFIEAFDVELMLYREEWADDEFSRFVYSMPATRRSEYYFFAIIAPLLIILTIAWMTYFLPDYNLRIDVGVGTMLLVIAFKFTLNDSLPRLAYLTLFDAFMFVVFLLIGFTVVINIYGKWLVEHDHKDRSRQITKVLVWLSPTAFALSMMAIGFYFL